MDGQAFHIQYCRFLDPCDVCCGECECWVDRDERGEIECCGRDRDQAWAFEARGRESCKDGLGYEESFWNYLYLLNVSTPDDELARGML